MRHRSKKTDCYLRVPPQRNGAQLKLDATHVLGATGRQPDIDNLGLEAAGVGLTDGRIVSDEYVRTSNKPIYICGEAAGRPQVTHVSERVADRFLKQRLTPWTKRGVQRLFGPRGAR